MTARTNEFLTGPPVNSRGAILIACCIALAALACAFALDRNVAFNIRNSGVEGWFRDKSQDFFRERLKDPGYYYFTLILAVAISLLHRATWRSGIFLLATTGIVSALNWLIKWAAGRFRPFRFGTAAATLDPHSFAFLRGGWRGGLGPNLSFPSGHTMLAFATAAALVMLFPRWKWRGAFYVVASIVAAERVLENAHWLSDVIAGIILGVGGVRLVVDLTQRFAPLWTLSLSPLETPPNISPSTGPQRSAEIS